MAANAPNPNQPVIDEVNLVPAGLPRTAHNSSRNRIIALGGFWAEVGGTIGRFLIRAGSIFRNPNYLAESIPSQINATIKDHNKANPDFATAINSKKASFLHVYAQMWRLYKYGGMPMDPNAVINAILLIMAFMITNACQRL